MVVQFILLAIVIMSLLVSIQAKIMVVELFKIFMELVVFVLMLLTDTAGESE